MTCMGWRGSVAMSLGGHEDKRAWVVANLSGHRQELTPSYLVAAPERTPSPGAATHPAEQTQRGNSILRDAIEWPLSPYQTREEESVGEDGRQILSTYGPIKSWTLEYSVSNLTRPMWWPVQRKK